MRARTSAGTAAVLAATVAITLAGCGGSGGGDDAIASASGTPTTAGTTATTTPAATGAPLRIDPALALPSGVTLAFDWPLPADAAKAGALTAAANFMQSLMYGVVKQNPDDPHLRGYAAGPAFTYARSYVQIHVRARKTVTGADRFYRPVATVDSSGHSAEVTFCEDESAFYSRELPGGKVDMTTPSDADLTSYDLVLSKAPTKTAWWQVQSVDYKERAVACKQ